MYGHFLLCIHRGGETFGYEHGLREIPFQTGDTLVSLVEWRDLARLEKNRCFVVVTTEYPHEEIRPHKAGPGMGFFALALIWCC